MYKVLENLTHDGKDYGRGGHIDLTKEQAQSLVEAGVVELIVKEVKQKEKGKE